jgi:hypothetical protein
MISINPIMKFPGCIAEFNGSTAVPIAPNWAITAAHVGGGPGSRFAWVPSQEASLFDTEAGPGWWARDADVHDVIRHPTADLALIRIDGTRMNQYQRLHRGRLAANARCVMAGYGRGGLPGSVPAFPRLPKWGTNVWSPAGFFGWAVSRFSDPQDPATTPNEAQFTLNDSGGGVFVPGPGGVLELAAIAVSSNGTDYGANSYALMLEPFLPWIDETIGLEADLNADGEVTPDDLQVYLSRYFAGMGDINGDGRSTVQDLFDYLRYYASAQGRADRRMRR